MTRRLLIAAALIAATLLSAPAAASAGLSVAGLSDQRAEQFADARITGLGLTAARLVVRWDAALADPAPVDAWLGAVGARGLDPLIVFNRVPGTRCPSSPCVAPTVEQFAAAFAAFRQRWPQVTTFAPWNEANVRSQPIAGDPRRAAQFYNAMVAACPSCTVLGAELLDSTDAPAYLRAMLPHMASAPRAWGVHNYEDVNHFRTTGTDPLLAAVPGEIWLTEAGGLVRYVDGSGRTTYPFDEQRAARATSFLFDYIQSHPDRITRVYLYGWQASVRQDFFDTYLLRADGAPRPAYDVAAARLAALLPRPAARRRPFPLRLAGRGMRVVRGGVRLGPFRCALPGRSRCAGVLALRAGGRQRALGTRRVSLRGGARGRFTIRLSPAALRRVRRGRITLVVRLTRPARAVRSYPRMRLARRAR